MLRCFFISLLTATLLSDLAHAAQPPGSNDTEFFESRVRPLLVERCYSCHSGTAKKLKGGLYLDSRDGVLKGGDSGPAATPGDPSHSRLMTAVEYGDPDLQMPPRDKLADAQIADLREWVKRGAPWPAGDKSSGVTKPVFDLQQRKAAHWAWKPVTEQRPPVVKDGAWAASPIDAFILAKLEANGLHPAPAADRATLLRRVYFDLIGLPPTADQVAAFVADTTPTAFERAVDGLLASNHFGERWGRHWLDVVRYAETHGHEFDVQIPNAWQYRDYVVRAFNNDVPYDRFMAEQIAGDLLEKPRLNAEEGFNESILGTGFWFLGEEIHSPVDIRQDEADRINSRLDTLTKAFQGLTVGCARCHDHKFDAISAKDHYALTGILLGGSYRQVLFETDENNRRVARALAASRETGRGKLMKLAAAAYEAGAERAVTPAPVKVQANDTIDDENTRVIVDYGSPGSSWWQDGFTFGLRAARPGDLDLGGEKTPAFGFITRGAAHRDEAWPEVRAIDSETDTGVLGGFHRPGRTVRTPKVTLTSGNVRILMRGAAHVYSAVDNHVLVSGPLHGVLLKTLKTARDSWEWHALDLTPYAGQRVEFEFTPVDGGRLDVAKVIEADHVPALPLANTVSTAEQLHEAFAQMKAGNLRNAASATTADYIVRHGDLFARADDPRRLALDAAVRDAQREQAVIVQRVQIESHSAPAILDGNGVDENVLVRGVAKNPGDRVPRRFLEAIAGTVEASYPPATSGRLQLVQAMLRDNDAFTSRVIVNRVWEHLFGVGIVPTVDNFGVLGQAPSHPELLDYLAAEFRGRQGWSVKTLIRSIVLSRAYQMASVGDAAAEAADPQNALLHRMPVRRLEAEAIRDEMLAVSGRLDERVGGPSVEVYLTAFMEGRGKPGASGPLDGDGRRSLYIKVRRNFLSPMMLAFDMPIPFATVGRRSVSNVPAQALILMNDPFVAQQAGLWGKRVAALKQTDEERIGAMYMAAFARGPTTEEVAEGRKFLADVRAIYGANDERAWGELGQVLFNTKEFIFVR